MPVQLLTEDDFNIFKQEIMAWLDTRLLQIMEQSAKAPPFPQFLKSSEVCKKLKISPGNLKALRDDGTIPFLCTNRTFRYVQDDILQMVKRHTKKTPCIGLMGFIGLNLFLC